MGVHLDYCAGLKSPSAVLHAFHHRMGLEATGCADGMLWVTECGTYSAALRVCAFTSDISLKQGLLKAWDIATLVKLQLQLKLHIA